MSFKLAPTVRNPQGGGITQPSAEHMLQSYDRWLEVFLKRKTAKRCPSCGSETRRSAGGFVHRATREGVTLCGMVRRNKARKEGKGYICGCPICEAQEYFWKKPTRKVKK